MFKRIDDLRFWCYKILPLVYDDSLSYYETLCKIAEKLNEVINDMNEIPQYIADLISDEKLKEIMSTLLNNLQEQIASANEGESKTATEPRAVGELVWLNSELYIITHDMIAGDQYFVGSNCEKITLETWVNNFVNELNTSIENETNARIESDNGLRTSIDNLSVKVNNLSIYNVKDYGAKGDGVTDDTAAIRSAISATQSSPNASIVLFPKGMYLISGTLEMQSADNQNLTFAGSGWGSTILVRDNSFTSGAMISCTGGGFVGIKDIRLSNGGKSGHYFSCESAYGIGINTPCNVSNVWIENGGNGIYLNSSFVTLDNVKYIQDYIYGSSYKSHYGICVPIAVHDVYMVNVTCFNQTIEGAHPLDVGLYISSADGIQIVNSAFNGVNGVLINAVNQVDDVYFSNCIFDNCRGCIINITGYNDSAVRNNVRFDGCHINGAITDIAQIKYFDDVQFLGCNIQIATGGGIIFSNCKNVSVVDCFFDYLNSSNGANINGVTLDNTNGAIINGNIFGEHSHTGYDIVNSGASNDIVTNNLLATSVYGSPAINANNVART